MFLELVKWWINSRYPSNIYLRLPKIYTENAIKSYFNRRCISDKQKITVILRYVDYRWRWPTSNSSGSNFS